MINIFIIGIAGKTGAGKSTVANYLKKYLGSPLVIDVDSLAKEIYCTNPAIREKLRSCFGNCVINEDGNVDYRHLGQIVFSSRERLEVLNNIMFCQIENSVKEAVKLNSRKKYIIIDAAILFNTGIYKMCDFIIWVEASKEKRQEFLGIKSSLDEEEILQRVEGQYVKKSSSLIDFTINNDTSIVGMQKKIKEAAEEIRLSASLPD